MKDMTEKKKGQEPFYPIVAGKYVGHYGISTRLYLAGMAMQGILANETTVKVLYGNINIAVPSEVAKYALKYADELIKQESEENQ